MSRIIDNFSDTTVKLSSKYQNKSKKKATPKKGTALSLLRLLFDIRKLDLEKFMQTHDNLFQEALASKNYIEVTKHYYALMAPIIEKAYGTSLHFTPPDYANQRLEEAIFSMHQKVAHILNEYSQDISSANGVAQKKFLDLGCSIGGIMRDIARTTNHEIMGVTLGQNEVDINNKINREEGLDHLCKAFQGDFNNLTLNEREFDGIYAIYALKYFIDLSPIFKSVAKTLKKKGIFLVYDIIKTEKYIESHPEHKKLVADFEYACGMPPLHTLDEMIEIGKTQGLKYLKTIDLCEYSKNRKRYPWYYFFDRGLLKFLINSPVMQFLTRISEAIGILPTGYQRFNSIFIRGTVQKIVQSGKKGILSGSQVLIFQKD